MARMLDTLGPFSSHPSALSRWRRTLTLAALLPLVLAGVVLLETVLDVRTLDEILQRAGVSFRIALFGIGFFLSMALTMVLSARLVEGRRQVPGRIFEVTERWVGYPWLAAGSLLLLFLGPFLAAALPALPNSVRFALRGLAIASIFGVLLAAGLSGQVQRADTKRRPQRRSSLFGTLAGIGFGLIVFFVVLDLIEQAKGHPAIEAVMRRIPFADRLGRPVEALLLLVPVSYVLLGLFDLVRISIGEGSTPGQGKSPARRRALFGWALRIWEEVRALLRWVGLAKPSSQREPAAPRPPEWWDGFRGTLQRAGEPTRDRSSSVPASGIGATIAAPLARIDGNEGRSPWKADSRFALLFPDEKPTQRAHDVLEFLESRYVDLLARPRTPTSTGGQRSNGDALVVGARGSGRTTTAVALALLAALQRGTRVLFFVSEEEYGRRGVTERIRRRLGALNLDEHVRVGFLEVGDLSKWLRDEREHPMPRILVATCARFEQEFFGHVLGEGGDLERLGFLLAEFNTVVVDDVLDFPADERDHLAFLLDKLRALAECAFVPLQVLVTARSVSSLALDLLVERFFVSEAFVRDEQVFESIPPPGESGWSCTVAAAAVDHAAVEMALAGLGRGLSVLLHVPGWNRSLRAEAEQRLGDELRRNRASVGARFRVVSDVRALPDRGAEEEPHALVIHVPAGDASGRIEEGLDAHLLSRFGGAESVVVLLTGSEMGSPGTDTLPVFVDRASEVFSAAHLRSLAPVLTAGAPTDHAVWRRLGVDETRLPRIDAEESLECAWRVDRWPGRDRLVERVFAMSALLHAVDRALPVQVGAFSAHPLGLRRKSVDAPSGTQWCIVRAGSVGLARLVRWRLPDDTDVRSADLAFLQELRIRHAGEEYVLEKVCRDDDGGTVFQTRLAPARGGGVFPVYHAAWTINDDRMFACAGTDLDLGLLWTGQSVAPLEVQWRIRGRVTEDGEAGGTEEVEYQSAARLSAFLLGPRRDGGASHPPAAETLTSLIGTWRTDVRGNPALSALAARALDEHLDGWRPYARVVAFDLPEDAAFAHVVFLVEPQEVEDTVSKVVFRLLEDPERRKGFWGSLREFKTRVERVGEREQVPLLRRWGRCWFGGVEDLGTSLPAL